MPRRQLTWIRSTPNFEVYKEQLNYEKTGIVYLPKNILNHNPVREIEIITAADDIYEVTDELNELRKENERLREERNSLRGKIKDIGFILHHGDGRIKI
jgi:hypothetical protein